MAINAKLSIGIGVVLLSGTALLWTTAALAQAFPEDSQPGVGAVLQQAPHQVRIRFDSRLEEEFSVIIVKDAHGDRVSGRTRLDPDSRKSLEVNLPALKAGDYHVYWSVVSWDGHRTKGDYIFHVKPQ
jgi:methionine-rich copper-binding protein CopC